MKEAVAKSLELLVENDAHLLDVDANERSITHRLAEHLRSLLPGLDVDCEYNRNRRTPKRLRSLAEQGSTTLDDTDGTSVFPDIIVHRRGTDENLLVMEVKKSTSRRDEELDMQKLHGYVDELGYQYAVFVKILTGRDGPGFDPPTWIKG